MSYVFSEMRVIDLITTCVVILIQEYGCSLEDEFTKLTYERISDGVLFIYQLMIPHRSVILEVFGQKKMIIKKEFLI